MTEYIFFSGFLFLFVCILSINKLNEYIPQILYSYLLTFQQFCINIIGLNVLLYLSYIFLKDGFSINLVDYYEQFSLIKWIYWLYVLGEAWDSIRRGTDINSNVNLEKYDQKNIKRLLLFNQSNLDQQERKLNTLKSFSLIPVLLLVINNLSTVLETFTKQHEYIYLDYLNIFLVLFLALYTFQTFTCYRKCQQLTKKITTLKSRLLDFEYPDFL